MDEPTSSIVAKSRRGVPIFGGRERLSFWLIKRVGPSMGNTRPQVIVGIQAKSPAPKLCFCKHLV